MKHVALKNMTPADAKERITEYFSRPGAVLARDEANPDNSCFYRLGKRKDAPGCAVGCLIPNSQYRQWFDSGEVSLINVLQALGVDTMSPPGNALHTFLLRAQGAHDQPTTTSVPQFLEILARIPVTGESE